MNCSEQEAQGHPPSQELPPLIGRTLHSSPIFFQNNIQMGIWTKIVLWFSALSPEQPVILEEFS